jgi:hypothetical protein
VRRNIMLRRNSLGVSVFVLALALIASAPAFANNSHKLTLRYDVVLKGTPLQAGDYTVRWENHSSTTTVTVSRKKVVLATVEGQLVERGKRFDRSAIMLDTTADGTRILREIRLAGTTQALVFSE